MKNNKETVIDMIDEMREYLDNKLHIVVSPANWNVYSELCDMVDKLKDELLR